MQPTKEERLTRVILTLFQLNGALLDWGDAFVAPDTLYLRPAVFSTVGMGFLFPRIFAV